MKTIAIDLIQIIAGSGLLYGYYHFALRNKKFHGYNRFYLLIAITISLFIPFLQIPLYFTQAEQNDSLVYQAMTVFKMEDSGPVIISHLKSPSHFFTTENIFYISYLLIAGLLITRFLISLNSIRLLYKKYPSQKLENLQFIDTTDPSTPFSFFRLLFWNRQIELNSDKGQQIFRHEWFHISQKHSRDIVYMELLTIICWFNPFFHLAKKELKAIHEFLADEYAVKNSESWEYAELLLMQALQTQQTRLVNPFFHNQIKRRIAMITLSKKPRYQYLRKIMVLPLSVALIVLFAFTVKTKEMQNNDDPMKSTETGIINSEKTKTSDLNFGDTTKPANQLIVIDGKIQEGKSLSEIKIDPGSIKEMNVLKGKDAMDKYGNAGRNGVIEIISRKKPETGDNTRITVDTIPAENNSVFLKTEISASFPGGESAWQNFLRNNLNSNVPVTKGAPAGSYTVWVQFIVHTDGSITDLKSLTNHSFGMEDEVMRVMKLSPNWLPAIQNGKRVTAYSKQAVTFIVGSKNNSEKLNEVVIVGYRDANARDNKTIVENKITPGKFNNSLNEVVVEGYKSHVKGPSFIGGTIEWRKYLERNVDANIPVDNGAPAGTYKTEIQFMVKADGTIADIKPMTGYGYGMEDEAIRVIKKVEQWEPAVVDGEKVNAYKLQPITFEVIEENVDPVFEKAESAPSFPGGQKAWIDFLQKSGIANTPVDHWAPEGTYKVMVQFIVEKDGTLSSMKPLTKLGYGMEDSVIKLLAKGPKWIPAKQNGKIVRAWVQQPVTFVVSGDDDSPSLTKNDADKTHEKSILSIYPNPTTNNIIIPYNSPSSGKVEIRITDLNGNLKSVFTTSSEKGVNNLKVNVASLAKGVYMINLVADSKMVQVYKMIKQ